MTVGLGRPLQNAGAPVNGTNEVQRLTIGGTPTGGTFKLTFDGLTTSAITWSATTNTLLANIQAALDALPNVGTNGIVAADVSLSSGVGALSLTFGSRLAKLDVPAISVANNSLTGSSPTLTVTVTTPGVTATGRGAPRGKQLIDTDTGIVYVNTSGTSTSPTWAQQEGSGGVSTTDIADGALSADTAGRAKMADDFFNAATVTSKFALNSFSASAVSSVIEAGALTGPKMANGAVTAAKSKTFVSTEQTGTGSSQNVAHGLGAVPAIVMVAVTEHPGTPDTGAFDVAEGAHDATNVIVTVTADVKFKVFAWA